MDQGNYEELLRVLAQDCWVELEYVQAGGNRIVHSAQDLRRHLTARGIPCDSVAQVRESITLRQRQQFARMLTPVFGCDPGAAPELRLRLPPGCTTFAAVHTCDNLPQPPMSGKIGDLTSLGSQEVDGSSFDEYKLRLPALTDWGLHDFSFTFANAAGAEKTCSTRAIVAPDRFWQPPGTRRFLGATTIQSSVRSRDPSHLGRGNYGDAVRAVQKLGSMGADFYSLGPLTMFDWPVDTPSATPFIPISVRLWAHHLIDVSEAMQRLQLTTALRNAHGAGTLAEITRLRSSRLLRATDYGVMLMRILREMYAEFCSAHRALHTQAAKDFEAFIAARGEKLLKPATFIALHDKFFPFGSTNDLWNWRNWPAEFQEWSSPQVIQYREESKADIEFVMFTQWLADHDQQRLAQTCRDSGMANGFAVERPIGLSTAAAETWYEKGIYIPGLLFGSAPDPWDWRGQSWSYAVRSPDALLETQLQPLIDELDFLTTHAGILVWDHGMGPERLFTYPADGTASDGLYMRYPLELTLRVVSLFSHRRQFWVNPELLGTKSPTIDDVMERWGAYAMYQQRFERQGEGCRYPQDYRVQGMIMGGTHNMFPEVPWALGLDITVGAACRKDSSETVAAARAERRIEVRRFLALLLNLSLLSREDAEAIERLAGHPAQCADDLRYAAGEPLWQRFSIAAHKSRAMARCRFVAVDIVEAMLTPDVINMPGVDGDYPNWLMMLEHPVEDWEQTPLALVFAAMKPIVAQST